MNGAAGKQASSFPPAAHRPDVPLDRRGVLLTVGARVRGRPFAERRRLADGRLEGRSYTGTVIELGAVRHPRGHAPNVVCVSLDGMGEGEAWWSASDLWENIGDD